MSSKVIIETQRLCLRTWTTAYGRLLDEHCNNDEVLLHLGGRMTAEKHQELVEWLNWQQEAYETTFWVLEEKENSEFLGFCGLVVVDEEDSTVLGATEIGWRLKPDAQGKGYAKEAAIACLYHAFEEREELRVVSRTVMANVRSWGLMPGEHAGLQGPLRRPKVSPVRLQRLPVPASRCAIRAPAGPVVLAG